MGSPVRGLRPVRAARALITNVPKPDSAHRVALLQRLGDRAEHRFHGACGVGLRERRALGHRIDQVILVHVCVLVLIPQCACTCLPVAFRRPLAGVACHRRPLRRSQPHGQRLRHVLERQLQDLVDPLDRLDLELALDVVRESRRDPSRSRPGSAPCVMPPRCAASSFSFRPPIGSTSPRSVISPVIATSLRTAMRVSAETSAVHMPMPALGPSFGVAPSGT